MKSQIKPSIGRVVIVVLPEVMVPFNNHSPLAPAVIVNTLEDTSYEDSEVNLKVLNDAVENTWMTSVPYSEGMEHGTWHWPPRV